MTIMLCILFYWNYSLLHCVAWGMCEDWQSCATLFLAVGNLWSKATGEKNWLAIANLRCIPFNQTFWFEFPEISSGEWNNISQLTAFSSFQPKFKMADSLKFLKNWATLRALKSNFRKFLHESFHSIWFWIVPFLDFLKTFPINFSNIPKFPEFSVGCKQGRSWPLSHQARA